MAIETPGSGAFSIEALQSKIDNKTKPPGSLGRIESLAHQIGALQQTYEPKMESCQLTIFAADHGIVESGVSAYPQEVTQQMVLNFLAGGAAANVFANTVGVDVQVVDSGVAGKPIDHPDLIDRRIAAGTANAELGPAMTGEQLDNALRIGREIGAASGSDAVCFGEMGIGNTSAATLILHKLLKLPLKDLTGRGTGLDDDGLSHKYEVLARAAARSSAELGPETILAEYGGFEIAMMSGAILGAAENKTLVLVDGFISTSAAAAAIAMDPEVADALVFAHKSLEHGHTAALKEMGVSPLLELDLILGEGTGALLAWPLVRSAAAMLRDMASFDSAGVSGPA